MKLEVIDFTNKSLGQVALDEEIFGFAWRPDLVHRCVRWQLAKRRSGTHSTKTISDISGSTRKIYRQKGTGGARHGSHRAVLFRGGAVAHGPVCRSHEHSLPKKIRKQALKSILSAKVREQKVKIIDFSNFKSGKTAEINRFLSGNNLRNGLIVEGDQVNQYLKRALSSLETIFVLPSVGANVYDIMRRDYLILTPNAVKTLEERLK